MRKEILDALKAKFSGVSDNVLGRIADKLSKTATTQEQVKTAVEGMTIQQVIESYGDSRATEASNTARENAVKDYESRYGLKDGAKVTDPNQAGGAAASAAAATGASSTAGGEEAPAWAKAFMERLDKLEASKTTETRKQQLNAIIGKLPETMRKAYERLPLDKYSDEEFSAMLGEVTTEVEGIVDETKAKGGVFGKPSAAGGQPSTELSDAQRAAIAHRDGVPTADSQPF